MVLEIHGRREVLRLKRLDNEEMVEHGPYEINERTVHTLSPAILGGIAWDRALMCYTVLNEVVPEGGRRIFSSVVQIDVLQFLASVASSNCK